MSLVTWSRLSVSKLSDIAANTNFSILASSTGNPGIIPSDDPGEALSVSSKYIHLSKHAKKSAGSIAPCDHNAQTSQTNRQTDTDIVA